MDAITALNGNYTGATLHIAVVASGKHGYVAMSVPHTKRRMTPADAIVGTVSAADSNAISVVPYNLQSYKEDTNQVDDSYGLHAVGLVKTDHLFSMCFTRQLGVKGKEGISWSLEDMPLNFAVGATDHLARHTRACSLDSISLASYMADADTIAAAEKAHSQQHEHGHGHGHGHDHPAGGHTDGDADGDMGGEDYEDEDAEVGPVVHGWLMILAWALILPLGMLAPRYRDAVGDLPSPFRSTHPRTESDLDGSNLCGPTKRWFTAHQVAQWTGTVLFIVAIIVIISHTGLQADDWEGAMRAHGGIGITLLVLLPLHIAIAVFRPSPEGQHRWLWRHAHVWGARTNILLAFINLLIGPAVYYSHSPGSNGTVAGMYVMMALFLLVVLLVAFLLRRRQLELRPAHAKLSAADNEEGHVLLSNVRQPADQDKD